MSLYQKIVFFLLLLGVSSLLTGCQIFSNKSSEVIAIHNSFANDESKYTLMPDLINTDLDKAGQNLTAAGYQVIVKRMKHMVPTTQTIDLKSFESSEIVRPFQSRQWNHMIAEQEPMPNMPLLRDMVIILTAGIHHGAGPFRPWLDSHAWSVAVRGESSCKNCHTKEDCNACHTKIGLVKN